MFVLAAVFLICLNCVSSPNCSTIVFFLVCLVCLVRLVRFACLPELFVRVKWLLFWGSLIYAIVKYKLLQSKHLSRFPGVVHRWYSRVPFIRGALRSKKV